MSDKQSPGGKSYSGGFYTGGQPDEPAPQGRHEPAQQDPSPSQSDVRQTSTAHDIEPEIDQWYWREDTQERFVVTDYDAAAGTVEIQTADGTLDEIEIEAWRSVPLALAGESQDWTEPLDDEPDDDNLETPRSEDSSGASAEGIDRR